MSAVSLIGMLLLVAPGLAVEERGETQITLGEVRAAMSNKRSGRMSIEPAPAMPPAVGQAVCGRVGLGKRGMPERFLYLRYSNPHHATRMYFERDRDALERERFSRLWKQLACPGL